MAFAAHSTATVYTNGNDSSSDVITSMASHHGNGSNGGNNGNGSPHIGAMTDGARLPMTTSAVRRHGWTENNNPPTGTIEEGSVSRSAAVDGVTGGGQPATTTPNAATAVIGATDPNDHTTTLPHHGDSTIGGGHEPSQVGVTQPVPSSPTPAHHQPPTLITSTTMARIVPIQNHNSSVMSPASNYHVTTRIGVSDRGDDYHDSTLHEPSHTTQIHHGGPTTTVIPVTTIKPMPADYVAPSPFMRRPVSRPWLLFYLILGLIRPFIAIIRVLLTIINLMLLSLTCRVVLLCVTAPRKIGDAPLPRAASMFVRFCVRIFCRVTLLLMGFWYIPRYGSGSPYCCTHTPARIIVSNHISFCEAMIIIYHMGCSVVGKAEIGRYPFIGPIAAAMQCIFVDRSNPDSKHAVVAALHERVQDHRFPPILIFPEGTVTNGEFVIQFQKGVFTLGAGVIPVAIRVPYRYFSSAWTEWGLVRQMGTMVMQFYNCMHVEYLPVYWPTDTEKANPPLFALNVQSTIAHALNVPVSPLAYYDSPVLSFKRRSSAVPDSQVEAERHRRHNESHWNHIQSQPQPSQRTWCCRWRWHTSSRRTR